MLRSLIYFLLIQLMVSAAFGRGTCQDLATGYTFDCDRVYCSVEKVEKNQGFCATATAFIKETLPDGYQMCCTQNEVIKRPVSSDQVLLCNRLIGEVHDKVKDPQEDFANYPADYCCTASVCNYFRVNMYKGEKVVCTASGALKIEVGNRESIGAACNNSTCYKALLGPGEQLTCKRFYGLPVAANELKSFGREVEKVASFLNSKERCKQSPFRGEFTHDSGERTADQSYQTDSYASVCSNP